MPQSVHSMEYRRLLEILVELRKQAGMTQRDVSAKLKRPHSYCGKVEIGERRLDVAEFIWYCRALKANPKDVFHELLQRKRPSAIKR